MLRFALTVIVALSAAAPAWAQNSPQEALASWSRAYAAMDGAASAAAYAPEARLWGTAARTQTVGREAIAEYFASGARNLTSRHVSIGEHAVQMFGDVAVVSGHYAFENTRADGTSTTRAARFSMAMATQDGRWVIVNHHSSLLPNAPAAAPRPQ